MSLPRRPILTARRRARTWTPPSKGTTDPRAHRALRSAARVLLWGLLGILVVRGAFPRAPAPPGPDPLRPPAPRDLGAFAAAFAAEYLTVGPDPSERVARLAALSSPELAADLVVAGRTGAAQRVLLALPAGVTRSPGGFTVTVAARVIAARDAVPRWVWLAVPVAVGDGALAVAGAPALVPAPEPLELPPPGVALGDPALAERARPVLARFFASYLGASDPGELAYLTSPGAHLPPPPPFARRVFMGSLTAAPEGNEVVATVRVLAVDRGGLRWPLGYVVRLAERSGRLEVASLSPLPPAPPLEEVMIPRTP